MATETTIIGMPVEEIPDEAASRDKPAQRIDRGYRVASRQRRVSVAPAERTDGHGRLAQLLGILPYAESLGVTIKHEPLTRDQ